MDTVYIIFKGIITNQESVELQKILDSYGSQMYIKAVVSDCEGCINENMPRAVIRILYYRGDDIRWLNAYQNQEVLIVNSFQDINDILLFYSQYNYNTLENN